MVYLQICIFLFIHPVYNFCLFWFDFDTYVPGVVLRAVVDTLMSTLQTSLKVLGYDGVGQ